MPASWMDCVPCLLLGLVVFLIIGLATPDLYPPPVTAEGDGEWEKWACETPPRPTISASVSNVTTSSARISATHSTVTMPGGHFLHHSFEWNDGNTSKSRTVTSEGTYTATITVTAERGGEFCDNSNSDSVTVKFKKKPTLEPCGSSDTAPTCQPTPSPTPEPTQDPCPGTSECQPTPTAEPPTPTAKPPTPCVACVLTPTPRPTKTPVPTDTPGPTATPDDGDPDPTDTPRPTNTRRPANTPVPLLVAPPRFEAAITVLDINSSWTVDMSARRWMMLEQSPATLTLDLLNEREDRFSHRFTDFKFKLNTNPWNTGMYLIEKGQGCADGFSSETDWLTKKVTGMTLARCALGSYPGGSMVVEAQHKRTGKTYEFDVNGVIPVNWHHKNRAVTYHADWTRDWEIIEIPDLTTAAESLRIAQTALDATTGGTGFTFADDVGWNVVVRGYRGDKKLPPCRGTENGKRPVGCTKIGLARFPHFNLLDVHIQFPPRGYFGDVTEWTSSRNEAREDPLTQYYLPMVLVHELLHSAGVGHIPLGMGVMEGGYNNFEGYTSAFPAREDIFGLRAVAAIHH